jgi:hypothetical protein
MHISNSFCQVFSIFLIIFFAKQLQILFFVTFRLQIVFFVTFRLQIDVARDKGAISSLRDGEWVVERVFHPEGMAACSRWLSLVGDTTGKNASACCILEGCQTCAIWHPCRGAVDFVGACEPVVSNAVAFSTTGYRLSSLRDGVWVLFTPENDERWACGGLCRRLCW